MLGPWDVSEMPPTAPLPPGAPDTCMADFFFSLVVLKTSSFHCLVCHGFEERGGESVGLLAAGLFNNAAIISLVSGMALNLAKKLTIYTNGSDELAADIEANARIAGFPGRVTVEKRRIKSVRMVALWEASDVVVALEDGTEIKETFLVSLAFHFTFQVSMGLWRVDGEQILTDHLPFGYRSVIRRSN